MEDNVRVFLIAGWLLGFFAALYLWMRYASGWNFIVFWCGLALLWFIFVTVMLSVL